MVQDNSGLWHLFYTGGSRAEGGLYQRIGHATSQDMHNWTRVENGLCMDLEARTPSIMKWSTKPVLARPRDA